LSGDPAMNEAKRGLTGMRSAIILASHVPSFANRDVEAGFNAVEELKGMTQLALLTRGMSPRLLTSAQIRDVVSKFDVA
jgi:hypothetical protein